jgi:2-polyprenyl-3-methyl-5-hydroxy-6-metoxy-1,4-benzoquinol methylase
LITAHQVLEHVEEPRSFLKSIYARLNPGGVVHFELPNNFSFTSSIRKISPRVSYDYGFIQPPMHLRAYSEKTLKTFFNLYNLKIIKVFTCSNNNSIWGQVRDYKIYQKLFYSITGLAGRGSLLIGIAKKENV